MKIFEGINVPIKSWCESPEDGAMEQIKNLSSLPFIFKQVCLMPDTHQGYGMPIGGVAAFKNAISPNCVGIDIGCGMIAVKTDYNGAGIEKEKLKKIMEIIRKIIPVGFNHQKEKQEWDGFDEAPDIKIIQQQLESARKQLGTLGGGNHFIEIQRDEDYCIWLMIHSGSRNFGYQIAKEYNKIAQQLCAKWYSNIPPIKGEDGLAFIPFDTEEGKKYYRAMNYALRFALENRKRMMMKFKEAITEIINCDFQKDINIHHNYASMEHHFGSNVMIHRKGATSAKIGQLGIIPGSQGTSSYIVEGKGNPESFESCSHGAGRTMSRKKAREDLDLKTEQKKLEDMGVIHSIRNPKDLDEASSAYKDIDVVMREQADLVEIKTKLTPLAVIKG